MDEDGWELRSAVEAHRANPENFWIPDDAARKGLQVGDAARLIFDIGSKMDDGTVDVQGERIHVIVSEILDGHYIGILDSQPVSVDPKSDFYLGFGVEVAFTHEHVIDIDRPPDEYIEWQLKQAPEKRWPR